MELSKKLKRPLFLLALIISSSISSEITAKWGTGGAFVGGLAIGGLTAAALSNNSGNTTVVYSNGYYDPYGYYDYGYSSPYWEPYPVAYDGYYGGYYGYGPYWNNYAYGWRRNRGYRHRHHMRRHHVHHHRYRDGRGYR